MSITIDYSDPTPQYVIQIPRADMTLVQTTPTEIRQLNINDLRLALNDLMDEDPGIAFPTNHVHTAPLTVSGVTLARVVEILDPYVIEFEDGLYNVNVTGGNSNVGDKVIKNQVGVNTANSAGLQDPQAIARLADQAHVSLVAGAADLITALAWLDRIGGAASPSSMTLRLLDDTGTEVLPATAMVAQAEGLFRLAFNLTVAPARNYLAQISATDLEGTVTTYRAIPVFA